LKINQENSMRADEMQPEVPKASGCGPVKAIRNRSKKLYIAEIFE